MVQNKFQDQLNSLNEELTQQFSGQSLDWYLKQIRDLYVEWDHAQDSKIKTAQVPANQIVNEATPFANAMASAKANLSTKYVPVQTIKGIVDTPPAGLIGSMLLFTYDPKMKATLPYYDTFPLIFMINHYGDQMLGLNMHYLPPRERAFLFDSLVNTLLNTKDLNDESRLNVTYKVLSVASRFKLFKPCIKKYILRNIRSRVMVIRPQDWDKVLMMPLARFMKSNQERVWQDSIRQAGWR